MKPIRHLLATCAMLAAVSACSPSPQSGSGFRLPDGDAAAGQKVFLDMQCNACHTLPDVDLPELDVAAPVAVVLGGPVSRVKTYGDLVTAIINPSHKLITHYPADEVAVEGQSFMPVMNDFMTVRQLIDVVAFLQGQYRVVVPTTYPYAAYRYR